MRAAPAAAPATRAGLTAREVEVLSLVRQGLGNKEIGQKLGISMRTAKGHVATILEKLGASGRLAASLLPFRTPSHRPLPLRCAGSCPAGFSWPPAAN